MRRESHMASDAWIAVLAALGGGALTGVLTLSQARLQHRYELTKVRDADIRTLTAERRIQLRDVYARYRLAADRLENAIRKAVGPVDQPYELAQNEYDAVCQELELLAPLRTVELALSQRTLFNSLSRAALTGNYHHDQVIDGIRAAAAPVLEAMRTDLGSVD